MYTSRIHWVPRGTGPPKDKDEVNKREVSECDGCVCDLNSCFPYFVYYESNIVYYESIKSELKTNLTYECGVMKD